MLLPNRCLRIAMMDGWGIGGGGNYLSNLGGGQTRPRVERGRVTVVEAGWTKDEVAGRRVHIRDKRARDGKTGPGKSR